MTDKIDNAIARLVSNPPKDSMMGGMDSASRYDKQFQSWNPTLQSADADILADKDILDARSLHTVQNDGYVSAAQAVHQDSVVGARYRLNAKPVISTLGIQGDSEWQQEFQEEVETKFALWAESYEAYSDAERRKTLTEQIRLAVACELQTGEVLASAEYDPSAGSIMATNMLMMDVTRLRTPYQHMNDSRVRGGVRVNRKGAPKGYYILNSHPGDQFITAKYDSKFKYVTARTPHGRTKILHIAEQKRPGQTRGVSILVAGLKEMRITKQFRNITLQNAVVNAMFAAAIESELPTSEVFQSLGSHGNFGEITLDYAQTFLEALGGYTGASSGLKMDGVKIPHLFPGTKLTMHPAGKPGGVGQDFEKSLLRYMSSILGISYEQFSKDYSSTNYSSARAGMLEAWKSAQVRKRRTADRYASTVYRLFFEEAVNKGMIESMKYSKLPDIYDPFAMDAFTNAEWIGAGFGQIDELKETQASILKLKYRLTTREHEAARMGRDWRDDLAQHAREDAAYEEAGVEISESNAINAASGSARETGAGGSDPKETTDG